MPMLCKINVIYLVYIYNKQSQMNLTDLDKSFSDEFGMSKNQARKQLTFLNKEIKKRLLFGEEITLREIGTFKLRIRNPRPYKNFQTGKMDMSTKHYFLDFFVTKKMNGDLRKKTVY